MTLIKDLLNAKISGRNDVHLVNHNVLKVKKTRCPSLQDVIII